MVTTVGRIVIVALGLLVIPLAVGAQQPGKMHRIGILGFARADDQRAQAIREVF